MSPRITTTAAAKKQQQQKQRMIATRTATMTSLSLLLLSMLVFSAVVCTAFVVVPVTNNHYQRRQQQQQQQTTTESMNRHTSVVSLYSSTTSLWTKMDEPKPEVDPRRKDPDDKPSTPVRMPVIDTDNGQMDVISRLLKDRILLLGQQVDDEVANVLVAQLLYLANEDPTKDITLYINSPGGSVSAGMAIYDTMQYVPCDVATVCFGMAASMGAFLLGAGAKGKRRALPNSRIMIHQPLGGAQGQAADIEIQAKEILFIREVLNTYIAEYTDQPKDKIEADCDRDFYMTPEEAMEYGIIDEVIVTKSSHIPKPAMPVL